MLQAPDEACCWLPPLLPRLLATYLCHSSKAVTSAIKSSISTLYTAATMKLATAAAAAAGS